MVQVSYQMREYEGFIKFKIVLEEDGKKVDANISVVLRTHLGNEYVYLPEGNGDTRREHSPEYPEKSVRIITHPDTGEYVFYFSPNGEEPVAMVVFIEKNEKITRKVFEL